MKVKEKYKRMRKEMNYKMSKLYTVENSKKVKGH
jgi:hypothetical protein